jgi:hypothetical protein
VCSSDLERDEVVLALKKGFEQVWSIEFSPSGTGDGEEDLFDEESVGVVRT